MKSRGCSKRPATTHHRAAAGGAHEVPIHPYVPAVGATAAGVLAVFTAVVVFMDPGPLNGDGTLKFISEGMREHCGWSGLVLGTTGSLVALCDLVPAVHVGRGDMAACVLVQLIGWNVVLGVEDTGWALHYVGLACFCASNIAFNYVMSRTLWYGHALYRCVQSASAALIALFAVCFAIAHALPTGQQGALVARDVAVLIEFLVMASVTANTLCLMWSLNAYSTIALVFTVDNNDTDYHHCYYAPDAEHDDADAAGPQPLLL